MSAPVLSAGIAGRLGGDARRFANLGGRSARSSGVVPGVNQSGFTETRPGITKQGDPGLRRDLFLAAERARHQDPQLAAKYYRLIMERRLHHYSAVCHLATTLVDPDRCVYALGPALRGARRRRHPRSTVKRPGRSSPSATRSHPKFADGLGSLTR